MKEEIKVKKKLKSKKGFIKLITGPMFSGKTSHLIKEIKYYKKKFSQGVMIFKPTIDNRTKKSKNKICTHNLLTHNTFEIENNKEILELIKKRKNVPNIIFFSEINFFHKGFNQIILEIQNMGINIICEGLNKDYLGNYFPEVKKLLHLKIKIKLLVANCYRCFGKATLSKRLIAKKEIIVVGGRESYAPVCAKCHLLNF